MSGFESDLREKILGTNAHIQITREDGDFTEWRDVKARVDHRCRAWSRRRRTEDSEVVIASQQQRLMNVIIKGIDPATVGKVTELVQRHSMTRTRSSASSRSIDDPRRPARCSQPCSPPRVRHGASILAPADMPRPGDPIDFSAPGSDADRPPPLPADRAI